jgi:hypothetical protein
MFRLTIDDEAGTSSDRDDDKDDDGDEGLVQIWVLADSIESAQPGVCVTFSGTGTQCSSLFHGMFPLIDMGQSDLILRPVPVYSDSSPSSRQSPCLVVRMREEGTGPHSANRTCGGLGCD